MLIDSKMFYKLTLLYQRLPVLKKHPGTYSLYDTLRKMLHQKEVLPVKNDKRAFTL